jgi:glutamyl/glutaminyl-tRNA synthetase
VPDTVVTRFAPSPTGYVHIGGARTALFNWLWARRTGGKFLLRIEDTDLKRNTPTATAQVMADLRWLGIEWDEGPEVGGPNAPYLQSQRLDIYNRYIRQLLDQGKAYELAETPAEREARRKETEKDGFGRIDLTPATLQTKAELEEAKEKGIPAVVYFKVDQSKPIVVSDMLRGTVSFDTPGIGDIIIRKSDGFPTYNFACVVDDHDMKITHVLRGQEHLMNLPSQQVLWEALFPDEKMPQYAHMSVTVSDTGGKLSKRERPQTLRTAIKAMPAVDADKLAQVGGITPDEVRSFIKGDTVPDMPAVDAIAKHLGVHLPEINIVDFFRSGYIPETMVNFMAMLGWNPGDQREIMTRDEIIQSFDLSRLTKSNSLFDRKKLLAFNTEHLRLTAPDKVLGYLKAFLKERNSPLLQADDALLARIIKLCEGARTLEDIERKSVFVFVGDDQVEFDEKAVQKVLMKDHALEILRLVRDELAALPDLSEHAIEEMLRKLAETRQVGLGKVAQPLRVALCGTTISLPIFDAVNMLGRERTLRRIDLTLERFKAHG